MILSRIISSYGIFFILFFLFSIPSIAQHQFYGRVVDAETKEPIPYATIFLTNTTFGVAAGIEGEFEIDISSGSHEVIVRLIGYETLTFGINTANLSDTGYRIELVSAEQDLDLIEVEEERDPIWYKNLERFKQNFIGQSDNAKKTQILNEEVLLLDSESNPKELVVKARDLIKIKNENLGYSIEYLLSRFSLNSKAGTVFYGGNPLFIADSTSSKSKQNRFQKNRDRAYYGSIQHLMQSLYFNKTAEEGYILKLIREVPNPERPTDAEIANAKEQLKIESNKEARDSLYTFFLMKEQDAKTVRLLVDQPLDPENIIRTDSLGRKFLNITDFLQVTYTKEREEVNFVGSINTDKRSSQMTVIDQLTPELEIYPNGNYSDTFGLMLEGYMAWEKVADLMPLDYLPEDIPWRKK